MHLYQKKGNLFSTNSDDGEFDSDFTLIELEEAIDSLKKRSTPGNDGVKNLSITNFSLIGKHHCLRIFNKSWSSGKLIEEWKIAEVIMINKKEDDLSNSNNYRPISLTKCIGNLWKN